MHLETSRSSLPCRSSSSQRRLLENETKPTSDGPLGGVVVCLTGLSTNQKTKLHDLVQELGGRYARDLDTSQTTHLIAMVPNGAKYQTAQSCDHISIVLPSWLHACAKSRVRVDEEAHQLTPSPPKAPDVGKTATLLDMMDELEEQMDQIEKNRVYLFSSCQFFLLGFEEEGSDIHNKLCRFIRRGRGTIYSNMNESITHIIVSDKCGDEHRDVARNASLHHPNGPATVSPRWVLSSLKEQSLQSPLEFGPRKQDSMQTAASKSSTKAPNKTQDSKRVNSRLFRGSLFTIMRLTPPEGTIDHDPNHLQKLIASHGGQMLSAKWLDALKADSNKDGCKRRKCYVVTWGGYAPSHVAVHPLLSQIKRHDLCSVVLVTPIWVQTCVKDDKEIPPSGQPLLFAPQSWPIRRLVSSDPNNKKKGSATSSIRACVTGFVGSERTGLIYLLDAISVVYTECMKSSNTHLICKVGKGPKYDKALEWGLHVVSVEWLYHVARHGYNGAVGGKCGCEDQFTLKDLNTKPETRGAGTPKRKRRRKSQS